MKINRLAKCILIYVVVFLLWTAYRLFFRLPETIDEFVAKPLIWLAPLFFIKKNIFKNIISSFKSEGSYNIILGLSIGILYFILYTLFSTFQYGFPTLNSAHYSFKQIILQLTIALSTGFIEELLFRRFILEESLHIFNDSIVANSFTTILFTLIHLPIIFFVYKYSFASSVSYLLLLTISGFIYGVVYLHKKSLLASTITHAVWNFLGTIIR